MGQRKNQKGNKRYFETNKRENRTYPNLWNVAHPVTREKFITVNAYIKEKKSTKTT